MSLDLANFINSQECEYFFQGEISEKDLERESDKFRRLLNAKYEGSIYKINTSYSLNLFIEYEYESSCDRCLKPTRKKINTRVNIDLSAGDSEKLENEDKDFYLQEDRLEIEEIVISEINSSIPMKLVCQAECEGLCPKCGIDLNIEKCDCPEDYYDPRMEKLKNLFSHD